MASTEERDERRECSAGGRGERERVVEREVMREEVEASMRSARTAGEGGRGSRRASASGVFGAGVVSELVGYQPSPSTIYPSSSPLSKLLSSWRVVVGVGG